MEIKESLHEIIVAESCPICDSKLDKPIIDQNMYGVCPKCKYEWAYAYIDVFDKMIFTMQIYRKVIFFDSKENFLRNYHKEVGYWKENDRYLMEILSKG